MGGTRGGVGGEGDGDSGGGGSLGGGPLGCGGGTTIGQLEVMPPLWVNSSTHSMPNGPKMILPSSRVRPRVGGADGGGNEGGGTGGGGEGGSKGGKGGGGSCVKITVGW